MVRATPIEIYMSDSINALREEEGLEPLTLEKNLNASAEGHSKWMLESGEFSHTGRGGSDLGDRIERTEFDTEGSWTAGENLAFKTVEGGGSYEDDVDSMMASLMDSPGHRDNILSPDYTHVGIGIEAGPSQIGGPGGGDRIVATQNFGATEGEVDEQVPTDEEREATGTPGDPDAAQDDEAEIGDDPVEERDGTEDEEETGGGSCFVATAAYGDPDHPDVEAMRRFRDEHLVRFRAGRAFIRFYWIVGPRLAARVRPEDLAGRLGRGLVRAVLRVVAPRR